MFYVTDATGALSPYVAETFQILREQQLERMADRQAEGEVANTDETRTLPASSTAMGMAGASMIHRDVNPARLEDSEIREEHNLPRESGNQPNRRKISQVNPTEALHSYEQSGTTERSARPQTRMRNLMSPIKNVSRR